MKVYPISKPRVCLPSTLPKPTVRRGCEQVCSVFLLWLDREIRSAGNYFPSLHSFTETNNITGTEAKAGVCVRLCGSCRWGCLTAQLLCLCAPAGSWSARETLKAYGWAWEKWKGLVIQLNIYMWENKTQNSKYFVWNKGTKMAQFVMV